MRALSIRQPWAHAILRPVQSIIEIVGEMVSRLAASSLFAGRRARRDARWVPASTLPFGGIVARAQIVDVIKSGELHVVPIDGTTCPCQTPWYAGGFALVLADVEPLPFIPWKGSLGFFDVPDEIIAAATRRP